MSDPQDTTAAADRRGKRTVWILAVAGGALLAIVLLRLLGSKPQKHGIPPQVVKVARAVSGDMPVTLMELGTVTPVATVTVLPQLSGYLTQVGYREGEDVKVGQFLAQIDPRQYAIDLRQAQAQLLKDQSALAQARSDLARYAELRAKKAIAEQTVTDQEFAVKQGEAQTQTDEANVAQYRLDLEYCRITAPVAGRVGLRFVDPGNYVTASSSPGIAVITTMKPTTVEFSVAQNDLNKVIQRFNSGAKLAVTAYSSDNSRQIATGTLYAIGNQMGTSTGTVPLRASFPNADEALFPNEFVSVKLLVDTLTHVVLVPTPAVLTGAPGDYVYLLNPDHTVSAHKVTLGPNDGKDTAILSGLSLGDAVVIDGTDRLTDGARISIAAPQTAGDATAPGPGSGPAGKRRAAAPAKSNGSASR
ncbi:MAG TPA: efflux RND transporter periplasmic adaptor subunit [Steroidobacteraceae bacterium]|nr:efflux RND transporter periplasmic adaptor subunit [Steroidobacteraceae bacterium]